MTETAAVSPADDIERRWRGIARSLRKSRSAQLGFISLGLIVALALFGPAITADPYKQDLAARLLPPSALGGEPGHLLGTDQLGRDLLARTVFGARISLLIASVAVVIGGGIGVSLGLISGYFGGWVDAVVMRLADIQLAFPFILFVILVVAALGPSIPNLIAVLGLTGWVLYARVVRGEVLSLKEKEFVHAARGIGASNARIVGLHLLPNAFGSVIVMASFAAAQVIIAEAALSFLGLGVQPPDPSWGRMLSDSRAYLTSEPTLAIVPGMAIVLTVLGINLIGDWLRDELDPRLKV